MITLTADGDTMSAAQQGTPSRRKQSGWPTGQGTSGNGSAALHKATGNSCLLTGFTEECLMHGGASNTHNKHPPCLQVVSKQGRDRQL